MPSTNIDYVGIGFCSNDYLSVLPHIPYDSKVQMLEHLIQGGGPAATATVAAARLGMSAAFISTVGDDDAGKKILRDFEAEHVSTKAMIVRKGFVSPIAYCWIEQSTGKRCVAWTRGNLAELDPATEVDFDLISKAKMLHLDGHQTAAALAAADAARKHGVLVNFDAGTIRPGVEQLVRKADLLITSEEFARRFTETDDLSKAIFKLAETGARVCGITMGEQGSMVLDNGNILRCPAFTVKPVDTTGAGDVYHTAFGVRYLETHDLMECMRFASAVSALKCLKLGGRTGIPTRAQVDEFLRTH